MILAGELADAGDFTPGVGIGIPAYVFKGTSETVLNSTTMQDDDALQFTMLPGAKYVIDLSISARGSATSDIKTAWAGPADMVAVKWAQGPALVGSTGVVARDDAAMRTGVHGFGTTINYTLLTTSNDSALHEWGYVSSVTGGTFRFQFAQNALDAVTPAQVTSTSYMTYTRVS